MLESESSGYTPIVEDGKCSDAAVEKDLCSDLMVAACADSSVYD